MNWYELIGGGAAIAGLGVLLRLVLPIVPSLVQSLRNNTGGLGSHHVREAEWRGEASAILASNSQILGRLASGQDELIKLLTEIERRGKRSEEAIDKILNTKVTFSQTKRGATR